MISKPWVTILAKLEDLLGKKVDIIALDKIEQKDSLFAFNILNDHKIITLRNEKAYISFKTKIQLSYLEHKPLIDLNNKTLLKRLDKNKIGVRDHA